MLKQTLPDSSHGAPSRMVVFGDSLSDTGRLRARTKLFYPPDVYWQSRASNGPLWVDYIATATGWKVSNYAVAGAATMSTSWLMSFFVSSLDQQVESFLEDQKELEKGGILAVIWIGPNNYLSEPEHADVNRTIQDIQLAVDSLIKGGIISFVIGTMPELGGLPVHRLARSKDRRLRHLTRAHNQALAHGLEDLRRKHQTAKFTLFQAFEINQSTIDQPSTYGFRNVTEACYQGDFRGNFDGPREFCQDPSGFKFWDGVHPNSRMHCFYAVQLLADLQTGGYLAQFQKDRALNQCRKL
jgi:phospholipase/lecithinase/hemolysin